MLTFAELSEATLAGPDAVARLLAGRPEAERRAVAPELLARWRKAAGDFSVPIEERHALSIAALGCGTLSELRRLGLRALVLDDPAFDVLADRRPPWLAEWLEHALQIADDWVRPGLWTLARRLVHAGLVPRPDSEAYLTAMMEGSAAGVAPTARPACDLDELARRAAALPAEIGTALGVDGALRAAHAGRLDLDLPALPAAGEPLLGEPLPPVRDVEELGALVVRLRASRGSYEELDRALDGISRMCGSREPFERELQHLLGRLGSGSGLWLLDWVMLAWAHGAVPEHPDRHPGARPLELLHARVEEVAVRAAAGEAAPLLAAPTHRGGWVDPRVLVERVATLDRPPGRFDLIQALHRLPPRARGPAAGDGPTAAVVAYALGGLEPPPGADPFAVVAAWTVRGEKEPPPLTDAPDELVTPTRHRLRAYIAQEWNRKVVAVRPLPTAPAAPVAQPSAWLPAMLTRDGRGLDHAVNGPLVHRAWPAATETYSAIAAARQHSRDTACEMLYEEWTEPLVDPCAPLGPMACLAIAMAFGVRERDRVIAAQDALVAALSDGRVHPARLGPPLGWVVAEGAVSAKRLGPAVAAAAAESDLSAETVRLALEVAVAQLGEEPPRDAQALLEPLNELCEAAGAGIADPAAREVLARLAARSSKAGRIARALLDREGRSTREAAAARDALAVRVKRGERWAALS